VEDDMSVGVVVLVSAMDGERVGQLSAVGASAVFGGELGGEILGEVVCELALVIEVKLLGESDLDLVEQTSCLPLELVDAVPEVIR